VHALNSTRRTRRGMKKKNVSEFDSEAEVRGWLRSQFPSPFSVRKAHVAVEEDAVAAEEVERD